MWNPFGVKYFISIGLWLFPGLFRIVHNLKILELKFIFPKYAWKIWSTIMRSEVSWFSFPSSSSISRKPITRWVLEEGIIIPPNIPVLVSYLNAPWQRSAHLLKEDLNRLFVLRALGGLTNVFLSCFACSGQMESQYSYCISSFAGSSAVYTQSPPPAGMLPKSNSSSISVQMQLVLWSLSLYFQKLISYLKKSPSS